MSAQIERNENMTAYIKARWIGLASFEEIRKELDLTKQDFYVLPIVVYLKSDK